MRRQLLLLLLLVTVTVIQSVDESEVDIPENDLLEYHMKVYRARRKYESLPQPLRTHYESLLEKERREFDLEIPEWTCDAPDPDIQDPENVHELRPQDVDVMAAFGDSVTAGNGVGANTLPGVAIENRGESWTIGGNGTIADTLTIPNIIKQFNPNVRGWSYSRYSEIGFRNDTHCNYGWPCAQLNHAEPGGTCRNILPQAIDMTENMRGDESIDFENDWKVITLFIGGNDLCAVCRRWDRYNPEQHVSDIKDAIDYLFNNMRRVMVNLVTMFDLSPLIDMTSGDAGRDIICNIMHNQFCDCAKNATTNAQLRAVQLEYWERLEQLINVDGTYDQPDRDDFTVVMQPQLRDMKPVVYDNGTWDMTFFAPDCFHPSRKGHFSMAYSIWNTMLTPVPEKVYEYPEEEEREFLCPSDEKPYIFTNLNSGEDYIQNRKSQKKSHHHEHDKDHHHDKAHHHHDDVQQQAFAAVVGVLLACLLVGALTVGVIVPALKKRKAAGAGTSKEQGFENPVFTGI